MNILTGLLEAFKHNSTARSYEKIVRGALCCECKQPLGHGRAILYNEDTTKRTVHWDCRTVEDDPERS